MREGAVFVLLEAIDGDEGQKQRFACGGLLKKEIHLILEFLHGALVYSEKSFGVVDFADVDGVILAVDKQVYLRAAGGGF